MASQVVLEISPAPLCRICRRGLYDFDLARSYGVYTPAMARSIMLLKYHAVFPLGGWFGVRLAEVARSHPQTCVGDVVIPVPVHHARSSSPGHLPGA
jgi:predicted amidophosphoribosyltransferase